MIELDLEAVRARWAVARMAGQDAEEAGNGWDDAKIRAVVNSWQDVSELHDEVRRLRNELDLVKRRYAHASPWRILAAPEGPLK